MIKWTSVKDGLPDHDCPCLVMVKSPIAVEMACEGLSFFDASLNRFTRDYQKWFPITHWVEITRPEETQ